MMDADNPTAPDAAGPAPGGPERRKSVRRIADTEDYPGEPKRFRTRRAADRAAREQILMTPEKALHVLRLMVGSAEMYGKARDAGRHTPAHLIPDPVQGGKILAKVIPPLAALRDELVALRASLASRPAPGAADEDAEDFRASMEISGRTTKRFIEGLPSREPPAPGEPETTGIIWPAVGPNRRTCLDCALWSYSADNPDKDEGDEPVSEMGCLNGHWWVVSNEGTETPNSVRDKFRTATTCADFQPDDAS